MTSAQLSSIRASRYFTRGWTLQELIAPKSLLVLDSSWNPIGRSFIGGTDEHWQNLHRVPHIHKLFVSITKIPERCFGDIWEIREISIGERMRWASDRTTTSDEDIAYCLMGIFGINMPLLYGEGERAFIRLQEEIVRTSDDQSIFAYGRIDGEVIDREDRDMNAYGLFCTSDGSSYFMSGGYLAAHPRAFARKSDVPICRLKSANTNHYYTTHTGMSMKAKGM